ncbi:MAG: aryl-sulfate sulfotransferase, partial [Halolamina sp.]
WHDVDRIDEDHLLVGDIGRDRVFIIDTETQIVEWEWDAQSAIPMSEGGVFPSDWTHLNDVELLPDDRIMVSLRNQDKVVFLDRETGLQENWTLGADGDHDVLYEQHNPEYIPEEQGGPAVLVADSEGHRVVEYQREDGEWNRTWEWSDAELRWPRDADRLPNGHTLITDSNGNRVIEVDRSGEIVWSTDVDTPYEADHFGPGGESGGGESASRLGLSSRTATDTAEESITKRTEDGLKRLYPPIVLNGLLFASPPWVGPIEITAAFGLLAAVLAWVVFELRWSGWGVGVEIRRPDR